MTTYMQLVNESAHCEGRRGCIRKPTRYAGGRHLCGTCAKRARA